MTKLGLRIDLGKAAMRLEFAALACAGLCAFPLYSPNVNAQELEPYAYAPNPVGVQFLVAAFGDSRGAVLTDPSIGITNVSASWSSFAVGYGRTFGLFGRSASFAALAPYIKGGAEGDVQEAFTEISRTGFADPRFRLSINLSGGPALTPKEFFAATQGMTLGMTVVVVPPVGQYHPTKLINIGSNRWSFKTEFGLSKPRGKWRWELSAGAWFFTDNDDFFGGQRRSQDPITTLQAHLIYTFKPRTWLAVNSTWYGGGESSLDGVPRADLQNNTRFGVTAAIPVTQKQSLKLSYSTGVTTRIGGDFDQFNLIWQYTWF